MPDRIDSNSQEVSREVAKAERETLQQRISDTLDFPLAILSLIWVGLLIVELVVPLSPQASDRIFKIDSAIWAIFALEFVVQLTLAPHKLQYLKSNFLIALSIVLPFVRAFRIFRAARLLRSISLVRITLIANRATAAIADIFTARGFQYVLAITSIITLLGATGVYYFEHGVPGTPFHTFGDAVWWAATLVTTINIGADPITFEGRVIGLLMRVVAVSIFGYVAASIASFLIGRNVTERQEKREEREAIDRLTKEVERMSSTLNRLQRSRESNDLTEEKPDDADT